MRKFYSIALFLWIVSLLPRAFQKKYRRSLLEKLGLKTPLFPKKEPGEFRIWIHAVSLGETKAVGPLMEILKHENPKATIFFSTATETGYTEAKHRQKKAAFCFYLPIDFSKIVKKYVKTIDPDLFILVETDFWLNLLSELKAHGTKIVLINGKISLKSFNNYRKAPSFANALFSNIDCFCLQSEEFTSRFKEFGVSDSKMITTGNIKFDIGGSAFPSPDLIFPEGKKIVIIALTHESEEEHILDALKNLHRNSSLAFLIAPRHPERFQKVEKLLQSKNLSVRRILEKGEGNEQFILVDQMGVLEKCYQIADVAILGGSFINGIGGHNIYEPARYGIPVLYGPYMYKQQEMVQKFHQHNVGKQIELSALENTLTSHLNSPPSLEHIDALKADIEGASQRTWQAIAQYANN